PVAMCIRNNFLPCICFGDTPDASKCSNPLKLLLSRQIIPDVVEPDLRRAPCSRVLHEHRYRNWSTATDSEHVVLFLSALLAGRSRSPAQVQDVDVAELLRQTSAQAIGSSGF